MPSDHYQKESLGGTETNYGSVWGAATPTGAVEEVNLPSGEVCLAKKLSIEGMIQAGILADADALTAVVKKHTRKVRGGKKRPDGEELNTGTLLKDLDAMKALVGMMDRALPLIVVSPTVRIHYTEQTVGKTTVTKMIEVEDREPGVVYTDQIDFADKMFLFDFAAGGLQAMLAFRG